MEASVKEDDDDSKNKFCVRRSGQRNQPRPDRCERYFTTFKTNVLAVPYIEVTVLAPNRKDAVRAAKQMLAPVSQARFSEVD